MLTAVESQALRYRRLLQQSPHLAAKIKATMAHVVPWPGALGAAGAPPPSDLPPAAVLAAAWSDLKEACSSINYLPVWGALGGGGGGGAGTLAAKGSSGGGAASAASASVASVSGGGGGGAGQGSGPASPWRGGGAATVGGGAAGGLRSVRSARSRGRSAVERSAELRSSLVLMSPPTAVVAGRQVALHWLYKLLLQAMHVCQVRHSGGDGPFFRRAGWSRGGCEVPRAHRWQHRVVGLTLARGERLTGRGGLCCACRQGTCVVE